MKKPTKFTATYHQIFINRNIPIWISKYFTIKLSIHPLPKYLYTLGHKTAKTYFQYKLSILKPSPSPGTYIVRRELPLFTTSKFFHQLACLSPIHLSIQWKHQPHLSLQILQNYLSKTYTHWNISSNNCYALKKFTASEIPQ